MACLFTNVKLKTRRVIKFSISASVFFFAQNIFAVPVTWNTPLSTLNQQPRTISVVTHALEEDLSERNSAELDLILKKWSQTGTESSLKDKKELRDKKNQFFFEEITKLNEETFAALKKSSRSGEDLKSYRAIAKKVLLQVKQHEIANPQLVTNFAHGPEIGFCFGRALLVHYLLLKESVPQEAMAKIFNLGQLMVKETLWKFHVAILLRDPQAGYVVVDPIQEELLPYPKWIELNKEYEIKTPLSRSRFYITDPRKFLPSFGKYDLAQLHDPVLKEYFDRLLPTLK